MFSILHISDLHRAEDDYIDNHTLLESLLRDRDRYTQESRPIRAPDAIIVSGDIIQGARLGDKDYKQDVRKQYEIATDFLNSLTEEFVAGDKSKIVICPGNHDICWNTAFKSMKQIDETDINQLHYSDFFKPKSDYRWCWQTRKAYKIVDRSLYEKRLDQYWHFLSEFYRDADLKLPFNPNRSFNLFELNQGSIIVAAFDSTFGNDCFAYHGAIEKSKISECAREIRKLGTHYQLQIGVWHHGTYGKPQTSDYMDVKLVEQMIGMGFRLGLHGHHHEAQATKQYIYLPEQTNMPIVSAGSLCAGKRELPVGLNRQYNIIELNEGNTSANVHVRERGNGEQFKLSYKPEHGLSNSIYVEWSPRIDEVGRVIDPKDKNTRSRIAKVEELISIGKYSSAINILSIDFREDDEFERALMITSLNIEEEWSLIIKYFSSPHNYGEFLALISAHENLKNFDTVLDLLSKNKLTYDAHINALSEIESKVLIKKEIQKND